MKLLKYVKLMDQRQKQLSIRALSNLTHPYALKVERDIKTIDEKIKILDTCNQLNMVYSIKSDVQIKIQDISKLTGKI